MWISNSRAKRFAENLAQALGAEARVRENLYRPSGTCAFLALYPALKRWAQMFER